MTLNERLLRSRLWSRTTAACLAGLVQLSACYTSRPLASAVVPRDTRITGTVTERARLEMAPVIGPDAASVEGVIADRREGQIELQVLNVQRINGQSTAWNGERVVFPEGSLTALRERKLHPVRTALFAGGLAAAAILTAKAIGLAGVLSGDDDGTPQPPNWRYR